MKKTSRTFIISLGGSLINPGDIDTDFLQAFKQLIISEVKSKPCRFIIVTGGGRPARQYQDALKKLFQTETDKLDWLGICATKLNAELVKFMFGKLCHNKIIIDPETKIVNQKKVLVASGWKPGRSTDYVAVLLAKTYGANIVLNLSNIDYAYSKNPHKYKNAKKIINSSWQDFRKIVGYVWKPGANLPFDPIASKLAEVNKTTVIIANGKNITNLKNIFSSKSYIGTTIS